jgi:hypothetical protein
MERMGLYSTGDRQRTLADALGELAQAELDSMNGSIRQCTRQQCDLDAVIRADDGLGCSSPWAMSS